MRKIIKSAPKLKPWSDLVRSPWFVPLCLILILVIVFSLRLIGEIDIGFHLRGGKWLVENGSFHRFDVFTYTVNDHEYIAMYWLFQVLIYMVFLISGYGGLSIFNSLMILVIFIILLMRMKSSGLPWWLSTVLLLATTFAMEIRFTLRPEIVTWLFLVLTLYFCDRYRVKKQKKWLFAMVVIQILWVNCHGLFILGWLVVAALFIDTFLQERRFDRWLFWTVFGVAAASLINPYFHRGIAFPFYLFTRLQTSSIFKSVISEFKSPWSVRATDNAPFFPAVAFYSYYACVFVTWGMFLLSAKKRRIHEFILLGGFSYLSFTAVRNIPLFLIVAVQILGLSLRDAAHWIRLKVKKPKWPGPAAWVIPGLISLISVIMILRVVSDAYYSRDRRETQFGLGLDANAHPVRAARFLVRNGLDGRMINDINSGSWLVWQAPQPVFIDGRLEVMKEGFFQQYLESYNNGGLARLIDRYRAKLVFFDHLVALNWNFQLHQISNWRMIYWDETSAMFASAGYAQVLPEAGFVEKAGRIGLDTMVTGTAVWTILQTPRKPAVMIWFEGLWKRQPYPVELMKMGLFAYQNNEFRAAELFYLEFLKQTEGRFYEVYFNLGSVYYRNNSPEKALFCYERVLAESPGNSLARKRRIELRERLNR